MFGWIKKKASSLVAARWKKKALFFGKRIEIAIEQRNIAETKKEIFRLIKVLEKEAAKVKETEYKEIAKELAAGHIKALIQVKEAAEKRKWDEALIYLHRVI